MKTILNFKTEFETADMVIRLETAEADFTVIGRRQIVVDKDEPALLLPPTFVVLLKKRLRQYGYSLVGVTRKSDKFVLEVNNRFIVMKKSFSINDVIKKLWKR